MVTYKPLEAMMFTKIIPAFLLPVGVLFALPLVSETLQLARRTRRSARGRRWMNDARPEAAADRQRLLFLVPAHNEERSIAECVESVMVMEADRSEARIIVVADNCSDATASRASAAGADLLERFEPGSPGKPQAIAWALDQLDLATFDCVVVLDADTRVDPGFADAIARTGPLRNAAVQSFNGIGNSTASWLTRLGDLSVKVRYEGTFLHKPEAGLTCPLSNGISLGVGLLERHGWPAESLTECWELYARYTAGGEEVRFAPDARAFSEESDTLQKSSTRRRRWALGRWDVLQRYWGSIVFSRKIGIHQKIDAIAELSSFGPVLQTTLAGTAAAGLLMIPSPIARGTAIVFLFSTLPTIGWTAAVWARQPDRRELARDFLRLPFYAFWRLGLAGLTVATGSERTWRRSPRE
jgi:1,2-diacylglycerol 3-beta-glucosyltransferase